MIHFLTHPGLDNLELVLLDKLSERVDLLLVEQSDEVVAETTHLTVPVDEQLLDVTSLSRLPLVRNLLDPLELSRGLGIGPLSSLFFEDKHHEGALFLAFRLFRTAVEQHGDLVYFQHDVGEEKFVTVLWLQAFACIVNCVPRLHSLASSFVQVESTPKQIIIPFDLADGCVEEDMELWDGQIVKISARRRQEVKVEGD